VGTSQSNPGPGGGSPLVPPWADDQPQDTLPSPQSSRFQPFRRSFGEFVKTGNQSALKSALGHYARKSTGGSNTAARRLGNTTKVGAALYNALTSSRGTSTGDLAIDVGSLTGMPCEQAIDTITEALTPIGGDSDKIRIALKHALVEALDGVSVFDPNSITDEVIVNTMIAYMAESIFLQVVQDAGKAWIKAETPSQCIAAENSLMELIKVEVDLHMAPLFSGNVRTLTNSQIINLQRSVISAVWAGWESYL
jgi:hypothetical protein